MPVITDLASLPLVQSVSPRGAPSVVIVQGQSTLRVPMSELAGLVDAARPVVPVVPTEPAAKKSDITAAIAEHNTDPVSHGLDGLFLVPKTCLVLNEATGKPVWCETFAVPVVDEAALVAAGLL